MRLKELITANKFISKFADEDKYDNFISQAVNHGLHKGGDWRGFVGPVDVVDNNDDYSVWKSAFAQLRNQSGGIINNTLSNTKITPEDQIAIIDSLEKHVNLAWRSKQQESTALFSNDGPYKLREAYSDYLQKLV